MPFFSRHQQTYITHEINKLVTCEQYSLEVELERLIKLIRAKSDYGPIKNQMEAARAIRKQLKYGNSIQQVRSLELMNLFVSQLVPFPIMYNDTKLLQRIQGIALNTEKNSRKHLYQRKVVKRCAVYVITWSKFIHKNSADPMMYGGLLKLGNVVRHNYSNAIYWDQSELGVHMDDLADLTIHSDNSGCNISNINIEVEAPKIKLLISDALAAATSLENCLLALEPNQLSIQNGIATKNFHQVRELRRKVLRYLQQVTEGEFLGSLIRANEELVAALTKYDELASYHSLQNQSDSNSYHTESCTTEDSKPELNPVSNPFDDRNKI